MNPILILLGLGAILGWLISDDDQKPAPDAPPDAPDGNFEPTPLAEVTAGAEIPVSQPVTILVLRDIFQNGARPLRRRDAAELLKAAPYHVPKSNAYRALAPSRRFALWLREDENGWLHFTP